MWHTAIGRFLPEPRRYGSRQCRRAFEAARRAAKLSKHPAIGTDHLLLGLLEAGDNVARRVLAKMGVDVDGTRRSLQFWLDGADFGEAPHREPELSRRARLVLQMGLEEATGQGQQTVGTGHLLTALVRDRNKLGSELFHVSVEGLRTAITREEPER